MRRHNRIRKDNNMTFLHWTQRLPRQHELSGFGQIRALNCSTGNSFEQSFMSDIRRQIADRSDMKRYNREGPDVIMDWTEIEAIINEAIECATGFAERLVGLLTPEGVKKLAMTTLQTEAEIINTHYPMSNGCVQHLIQQRDAEIEKIYGRD